MGLKSYHESFIEEQVNGEILSECDEEVLKNDLKVTSKLHRMRLLKVITGETTLLSTVQFDESPKKNHSKKENALSLPWVTIPTELS